MFISKREAEDRLNDAENAFRSDFPINDAAQHEDLDIEQLHPNEEPEENLDAEIVRQSTASILSANPHEQDTIGLDALDSLITPRRVRNPYRGRMDAQVAIAETSMIIGPAKAGKVFGISDHQVNAYAVGADTDGTSSKNLHNLKNPRPERKARVDALRSRLALKAGIRVGKCLDLLDDTKLSAMQKPTTIARVAKDMATIMDKVSDKKQETDGGIHFHLYRPEIKQENHYDTIEIGSAL